MQQCPYLWQLLLWITLSTIEYFSSHFLLFTVEWNQFSNTFKFLPFLQKLSIYGMWFWINAFEVFIAVPLLFIVLPIKRSSSSSWNFFLYWKYILFHLSFLLLNRHSILRNIKISFCWISMFVFWSKHFSRRSMSGRYLSLQVYLDVKMLLVTTEFCVHWNSWLVVCCVCDCSHCQ